MGLLDALDRGLGIQTVERGVRDSRIIPQIAFGHGQTVGHSSRTQDLLQGYRVHPGLNMAVRAIAQAIADVPIVAVSYTDSPGRNLAAFKKRAGLKQYDGLLRAYADESQGEILPSHDLLNLIERPLRKQANITQHDLIYSTVVYMELQGNAYWEKVFSAENHREVIGLFPLIDPRNVWVIPGQGEGAPLIMGYLYRRNAESVVMPADEMAHFAYFNPESPYYGLSPAEVLRQSLIADLRAIDWNRAFFDNDATPSGFLKTDQELSRPQAETARAELESRHRGVTRSHRVAVFGNGVEFKTITPTHRDMGFLELRKWTRDEILGVYGVPGVMVNDRESLNRATAQVERRLFYENCILPRLDRIEATLNYALVPEGEKVRLLFDISAIEALQEDEERREKIIALRARTGFRPNDILRARGEDPIETPEMNAFYIPGGMKRIDEGSTDEGELDSGERDAGGLSRSADSTKAITKDDPLLTGDVETYLPKVDLEAQRLVHEAHLPQIATDGARRGVDIVTGLGIDVADDWIEVFNFQEEITRWMDSELAEAVKGIDETTRSEMKRVIRNGMKDGRGAQQIAADLRKEFQGMETWRARMIARTEGGKAVSFGQHKLYVDTGVDKHGWNCQFVNSRPTHESAHNVYNTGIPIDEPFVLTDGVSMSAPRMSGDAKHDINCYCDEIPMVSGMKDTSEAIEKAGIGDFEKWLKSVEEEGEGRRYAEALGAYFREEGERYVKHLLDVAGA